MDKKQKIIVGISAVIALLLLASLLNEVFTVKKEKLAGSAPLGASCRTNNSASTSPATLAEPGLATSTVDCPLFGKNNLRVNAWLIASSTFTHFKILVARSNDGVDFYQESGSLLSSQQNATSTNLVNFSELSYVFASSTTETPINAGYGGLGTTSARLISFQVPSNGANIVRLSAYTQRGISGLSTTTNGMIWMEGIPSD